MKTIIPGMGKAVDIRDGRRNMRAARFELFAVVQLLFSVAPFAATPGLDTLVSFDTAWTLVYDGGKDKRNNAIADFFNAATSLNDGSIICTGETADSSTLRGQILLLKIDKSGKVLWKKHYSGESHHYGYSVIVARNNDLIIGGGSYGAPVILRTDSIGNLKWSKWYYDTLKNEDYLHGTRVTVNSLHETKRGTIICAAGDDYKGNTGPNNYAAFLELDSTGKVLGTNEWDNEAGYSIQGYCIDEASGGGYMLSGIARCFFWIPRGAFTGSAHIIICSMEWVRKSLISCVRSFCATTAL